MKYTIVEKTVHQLNINLSSIEALAILQALRSSYPDMTDSAKQYLDPIMDILTKFESQQNEVK